VWAQDPRLNALFPRVIPILVEKGCVNDVVKCGTTRYSSTSLGDAIVECGLTPAEGECVYRSLDRAASRVVTEHPLHMLYLVRNSCCRAV
jgi:hypothetical protein